LGYAKECFSLFENRRSKMASSVSPFLKRPSTRLGWWAAGLAIGFITMSIINPAVIMRLSENVPWRQTILPIYGILMMLCGLATFVVGLIAIIRSHERSWLVWFTLLPGASALLFVLGELLVPH
jgi:hypothetical protein